MSALRHSARLENLSGVSFYAADVNFDGKVTIEDAMYCDEIFSLLMGDKVEPRREFIEKNAQFVSNLDV